MIIIHNSISKLIVLATFRFKNLLLKDDFSIEMLLFTYLLIADLDMQTVQVVYDFLILNFGETVL